MLEDVSEATIMECAQLVKANSIEGCKLKEVHVVYTRWRNLLKTAGMEAGQVGYHDKSKVRRMRVEKDQAIVNKLNRTKVERFPDLAALQEGNRHTTAPLVLLAFFTIFLTFTNHILYIVLFLLLPSFLSSSSYVTLLSFLPFFLPSRSCTRISC